VNVHWGRVSLLALVVLLVIALFGGGLIKALFAFGFRLLLLAVVIGVAVVGYRRAKRALTRD